VFLVVLRTALEEKEARLQDMYDLEEPRNMTSMRSDAIHEPVLPKDGADAEAGGEDAEELMGEEEEDSYEPSQVDERFTAIYTDPQFALDPSHQEFSFIKGRSHVAQKKYADLKRLVTRDRLRRGGALGAKRRLNAVNQKQEEKAVGVADSVQDLVKRAMQATQRVRQQEQDITDRLVELGKGKTNDREARKQLWGSCSDSDLDQQDDLEPKSGQGSSEVGEDEELSLLDPSAEDWGVEDGSINNAANAGVDRTISTTTRLLSKKENKKRKEKEVLSAFISI
jgi:hypothetical protein